MDYRTTIQPLSGVEVGETICPSPPIASLHWGLLMFNPLGCTEERRFTFTPQSLRFIGGYSCSTLRVARKRGDLPSPPNRYALLVKHIQSLSWVGRRDDRLTTIYICAAVLSLFVRNKAGTIPMSMNITLVMNPA